MYTSVNLFIYLCLVIETHTFPKHVFDDTYISAMESCEVENADISFCNCNLCCCLLHLQIPTETKAEVQV